MTLLNSASAGSAQINFVDDPGLKASRKKFTVFIQLSIAMFTVSLVWFSFVYYPKVVDRFQNVGLPQGKVITVASASNGFPIETSQYRVVYERDANTYYAFIEGLNIADYADNKNSATLEIKSALSLTSICELNIIYVSTSELKVPQDLRSPVSCR